MYCLELGMMIIIINVKDKGTHEFKIEISLGHHLC